MTIAQRAPETPSLAFAAKGQKIASPTNSPASHSPSPRQHFAASSTNSPPPTAHRNNLPAISFFACVPWLPNFSPPPHNRISLSPPQEFSSSSFPLKGDRRSTLQPPSLPHLANSSRRILRHARSRIPRLKVANDRHAPDFEPDHAIAIATPTGRACARMPSRTVFLPRSQNSTIVETRVCQYKHLERQIS